MDKIRFLYTTFLVLVNISICEQTDRQTDKNRCKCSYLIVNLIEKGNYKKIQVTSEKILTTRASYMTIIIIFPYYEMLHCLFRQGLHIKRVFSTLVSLNSIYFEELVKLSLRCSKPDTAKE